MKHVIEPMLVGDFDEVTALWRATAGVGLSESDSRENIAAYLQRNPNLSQVARGQDGKIIGAILCGHDGRRGWLYHLAVDAAHRKQGIGKKLVETCLARLRAAGILRCSIYVFDHNTAGQAFWTHQGWKERPDLLVMQINL